MTEMTRERREYLARATEYGFCASILQDEQGVIAIDDDDLRALLSDSAWRERVESTLREIERFGHNEGHGCGYSCADMAQRAILDTGRGEGGGG